MIKFIIFDLDGVLADCKDIHFKALNDALSMIDMKYVISKEEHLSTYDGLPTKTKLMKLSECRGMSVHQITEVTDLKKIYTTQLIRSILYQN